MMCQGEALVTVLRLLVLMSVTAGGVPKKHFDALRREILHTYGHENVITLSNLQDAGALERNNELRNVRAGLAVSTQLDASAVGMERSWQVSGVHTECRRRIAPCVELLMTRSFEQTVHGV